MLRLATSAPLFARVPRGAIGLPGKCSVYPSTNLVRRRRLPSIADDRATDLLPFVSLYARNICSSRTLVAKDFNNQRHDCLSNLTQYLIAAKKTQGRSNRAMTSEPQSDSFGSTQPTTLSRANRTRHRRGSTFRNRRPERLIGAALLLLSATLGDLPAIAQTSVTIFGNAIPKTPAVGNDRAAVTLGVKFFAAVPGSISSLRFYRGSTNSNGYTAKLFTSSGVTLASARVKADTCAVPCWEQVNFASPIPISANITYIAAYYTNNGRYADDQGGLANGAGQSPLFAQANGGSLGGNGVYTYSTSFPDDTWNQSNYWVDVVFTPSNPTLMLSFTPPSPTVPANAPPGTVVAMVNASWSDGSPFTGTLSFGSTYGSDGGAFALSGHQIVVAGGLAADSGTTQNVSIVATQ
jgi:hypothetical protein